MILDWVPAHFPKDRWSLARFDGTALYEHADPRQGEHPDWGTYVFNYGRNEVRNFLVANALYWLQEFHIDGLRVDAVASMLYLDYSRKEGEWIPNEFGGRENLAAIEFMRQLNGVVGAECPGAMMIAEESTSWPKVTHPAEFGGLGFTHKWNMGWMHDTLGYLKNDPVHRRWHHHELTFGLLYAFTEQFVLPLSHDEVVHGKGSMLAKMAGDDWQRFANLRALYAWMWALPGAPLVFMGAELASVDRVERRRGTAVAPARPRAAPRGARPGGRPQRRLRRVAGGVGARPGSDGLPVARGRRLGELGVRLPALGQRRQPRRGVLGELHPGAARRLPRRSALGRHVGDRRRHRRRAVRWQRLQRWAHDHRSPTRPRGRGSRAPRSSTCRRSARSGSRRTAPDPADRPHSARPTSTADQPAPAT